MAEVSNIEKRTPEELQALLDKCEAPVLKQYLKAHEVKVQTVVKEDSTVESETQSDKPGSDKKQSDRKSNRARKRERQQEKKESMCNAFLMSGVCKFGDTCKFKHDLSQYMETKLPDLPGECPFTRNMEEGCPYGVTCRYLGTHPKKEDSSGTPAAEEGSAAEAAEAQGGEEGEGGGGGPSVQGPLTLPPITKMEKEINFFNKDVQVALRKKTYQFLKADPVLKEMGILSKHDFGALDRSASAANPVAVAEASSIPEDPNSEAGNDDPSAREAKRVKTEPEQEPLQGGGCMEKEVKVFDLRGMLYLAPLTTVGNLPFRRICRALGADVTCGEMALTTNLLQGQPSEWALLRRHPEEKIFGIQLASGYGDSLTRCVELLDRECDFDFIDVNMGCPIDLVCNKGAGSSLLRKPKRIEQLVTAASSVLTRPLTVKMRTGWDDHSPVAHEVISQLHSWGARAVTLHGRTRQQRYSKLADWDYISQCVRAKQGGLQFVGNGDVFSYQDYLAAKNSGADAVMVARGALIKPWVFTEIKEQRDWDISGSERLDILKKFCSHGLEHWGSDQRGVESTRRFLLEWLSFLHKYIPVGLLEVIPQKLHHRPPLYSARDDREALLCSPNPNDWVKITTMLLGAPPQGFSFVPKHKANSYASEAGSALEDTANG